MRRVHFLLTLLGVLAGLMAMHALGPHDRDHSDGHAHRLVAAALPGEATDEHSGPHHADDADRAAVSTQPAASVDSSPDGDGGASAGECLALLGSLLWLLISAVLAARLRRPILILRRVREQLLLLRRPPDPPCLTRLSILRC